MLPPFSLVAKARRKTLLNTITKYWKSSAILLLSILAILLTGCSTTSYEAQTIPAYPKAGQMVGQELAAVCGPQLEVCPATRKWLQKLYIFTLQLEEAQ